MKQKTINILIAGLSSGGAEHQAVITAELLANYGYNVNFITFSDVEDHYKIENKDICRINIAPKSSTYIKLLSLFCYLNKQHNSTIIAFGRREGFIALLCLYFNRNINIISEERGLSGATSTLYEKILMNYLYHRANHIVSNSYAQAHYLMSKKPLLKTKITTITNYTPIDNYNVIPRPKNDIFRIGIFARYHLSKNGERLMQAISLLKKKGFVNFVIEWYGNQHDTYGNMNEYYLNLVSIINNLGLNDLIKLHDHTKTVTEKFNLYDAMCLPSITEGFSNFISEVICCGIPMIASNVADNTIMIKDSINGYIFDPYNIDSIAEAIEKITKTSYEERIAMGQKARQIAEHLFKREEYIKKYIDLL